MLTSSRERVVITYNPSTGTNHGAAAVILPEPALAERAVTELDHAPLFDKQLQVHYFLNINITELTSPLVKLLYGWCASESRSMEHINPRPPLTEYPDDVFAP